MDAEIGHDGRSERDSDEKCGLKKLRPVKLDLRAASLAAAERYRTCDDCDARCCKVGKNSMRVYRIEAAALARRLREPDLAPRITEILAKARREIELRGLADDPEATYDCPLLDDDGRCLVHGPAQPAGCLTFQPVADGGCDHDLKLFYKKSPKIEAADRRAYGKVAEPLPIPLALLQVGGGAISGDFAEGHLAWGNGGPKFPEIAPPP